MGILDQIRDQVNKLSPEQVKEQLAKMQAAKAKQTERNKERNLSPEQKEKRTAYNKERAARPEVKEKMKEYHQRPEVKDRMKQYRQKRYETNKALIARAKELGLIEQPSTEQPQA